MTILSTVFRPAAMSSRDKKEAADTLATPSNVKQKGNAADEVEAADPLLVRIHGTLFLLLQ